MIIRHRPRSYVWLPLPLAILAGCGLVGVGGAVAVIDWTMDVSAVKAASALLGVAAFWAAPLLLEVRVISSLPGGAIAVRWPLGRFEAPAEGTRIDVRNSTRQRYVVWVTPTREVRLAYTYSVVRAAALAEQIKQVLELPRQVDLARANPTDAVHRDIDPAVRRAAAQEAKGMPVFLLATAGLTMAAVVIAVVLQLLLMSR